jgi:redox-sensitive bicupin YhaK (pirin superfamily)
MERMNQMKALADRAGFLPDSGRGKTKMDWLDSRHTFSFGVFRDSSRMGIGPLRVINDDRVAAAAGFPSHPHRDMEIISLVLEGQLAHKDSMGNTDIIQSGDVQYMSAGSGVVHSEFNPSTEEGVHFLQIWIEPAGRGFEPRYEKSSGLLTSARNQWIPILKPEGADGDGIPIRQDAYSSFAQLGEGAALLPDRKEGYSSFLQIVEGEVRLGAETMREGDALALVEEPPELVAGRPSRLLSFNLKT